MLDLWFEKVVQPACGGKAYLVRFADDFLVCFEQPQDAQRFAAQLPMRMHQFGLELAPEKTRRLPFGRRAWIATETRHEPRVTFDFLGMTHFGARTRQDRWQLQRRPTKKNRRKFLQKVKQTLKARWHDGILVHQRYLTAALQGFYRYFGYPGCLPGLNTLRQQVLYAWYQVLRRRSQRSPQGIAWYAAQGWFMAPVPKLRPRDTTAR